MKTKNIDHKKSVFGTLIRIKRLLKCEQKNYEQITQNSVQMLELAL